MIAHLKSWLPAFVSIASLVVLIGWYADVDVLVRMFPGYPSMKPVTAFGLMIAGFMVLARNSMTGIIQEATITGLTTGMIVVCLIDVAFVAFYGEFRFLGLYDKNPVMSVRPGVPSLGSVAALIVVCLACVLPAFGFNRFKHGPSIFIMIVGVVAIIGHAIGNSWMIYYVPGVSSGMAIHVAVLFVILGWCLGGGKPKKSNTQLNHSVKA
jgi:hypothetical protein